MLKIASEEGQELIKGNVCAECGAQLVLCWGGAWGLDSYIVRCAINPQHQGFTETESYTQALRRGKEIPPAIRDNIERRMMLPGGYKAEAAMVLLKARFPDAELDDPSAALFIMDCIRLDLDPFLGEIIPVTFKSKKTNRNIVQPLITENGYLSLAARACPEEWEGPPSAMPYSHYLLTLPAAKDKSMEELRQFSEELAKALCGDAKAELWVAIGKRSGKETAPSFGWFTTADQKKAQERKLPSANLPGNQARIRAINRWCREAFPEAKAKMKQLTSSLRDRAEGADDILRIIEAEYEIGVGEGGEAPPLKIKKGEERQTTDQVGDETPSPTKIEAEKSQIKSDIAPPSPEDIKQEAIPDFSSLYKLCNHFWEMQPAHVIKELGYTSQLSIEKTPWECWLEIYSVRRKQIVPR